MGKYKDNWKVIFGEKVRVYLKDVLVVCVEVVCSLVKRDLIIGFNIWVKLILKMIL